MDGEASAQTWCGWGLLAHNSTKNRRPHGPENRPTHRYRPTPTWPPRRHRTTTNCQGRLIPRPAGASSAPDRPEMAAKASWKNRRAGDDNTGPATTPRRPRRPCLRHGLFRQEVIKWGRGVRSPRRIFDRRLWSRSPDLADRLGSETFCPSASRGLLALVAQCILLRFGDLTGVDAAGFGSTSSRCLPGRLPAAPFPVFPDRSRQAPVPVAESIDLNLITALRDETGCEVPVREDHRLATISRVVADGTAATIGIPA